MQWTAVSRSTVRYILAQMKHKARIEHKSLIGCYPATSVLETENRITLKYWWRWNFTILSNIGSHAYKTLYY